MELVYSPELDLLELCKVDLSFLFVGKNPKNERHEVKKLKKFEWLWQIAKITEELNLLCFIDAQLEFTTRGKLKDVWDVKHIRIEEEAGW